MLLESGTPVCPRLCPPLFYAGVCVNFCAVNRGDSGKHFAPATLRTDHISESRYRSDPMDGTSDVRRTVRTGAVCITNPMPCVAVHPDRYPCRASDRSV